MRDLILVVNAGSSSMKFSLFETEPDGSLHAGTVGQVEGIGVASHFTVVDGAGHKLTDRRLAENDQKAAVAAILEWLGVYAGGERSLAAVGHRVVHGGRDFMEPVRVDHRVIAALEALTPLAPLHQPHHIAAIRAVADIAP